MTRKARSAAAAAAPVPPTPSAGGTYIADPASGHPVRVAPASDTPPDTRAEADPEETPQ